MTTSLAANDCSMRDNVPYSSLNGPLRDITVLELGSTVAGPFCGRLLADFGATVIKVEPLEGDAVRSMGQQAEGRSLYAASIFRNKQLISVDLRTTCGQDLVRRMTESADVLIENFRPGTLEAWGLGYCRLAEKNPGLVMVRISGYGQDGPYRNRPGYGIVCEAASGLRDLTGDPDRPPPRIGVSLTDCVAGLYGAFGVMLALHERSRSGLGQVIDTALYEAAFSFLEPHVPAYEKLGRTVSRSGSRLPNNTPNNLYDTADARYIHIAAGGQSVFRRLLQCIGRPELMGDARFSTAAARNENYLALDELIGSWTGGLTAKCCEEQLVQANVPASRIFNLTDIFGDPHYAARGMLVDVPGEGRVSDDSARVTLAGIVPRLSRTPGRIEWAGRERGADTLSVLIGLLGLSEKDVRVLMDAGVVHIA